MENKKQKRILGRKTNRSNFEQQERSTNKRKTKSYSRGKKTTLSSSREKEKIPKSNKGKSNISNTSSNISNKYINTDNNIQGPAKGRSNSPCKISTKQINLNKTKINTIENLTIKNSTINNFASESKHQKKIGKSSSTKQRQEISPEGSEDHEPPHRKQRNYDHDPLKFIRDLAIVLEGRDFCTAVSLEKNTKKIFISCNKFGDHYVDTSSRTTIGQHELINNVIEDILHMRIDLDNYETCKNLLEILYSNIVFHKNKTFSEFEDDSTKPEYLKYLFVYFDMVRPTRELREILKVPYPFAEPKFQDRIMRFVTALRDIIESDFLKNEIIPKKYKFDIKHTCDPDVHAELKLMNHYIQEKIISKDLDLEKMSKMSKVQVFLSPSRLPCEACKLVLAEFHELHYPLRFIYPENERIQKTRKLTLPNFMKEKWYEDNKIKKDGEITKKLIGLKSVIEKKLEELSPFVDNREKPITYPYSDKCDFGPPVSQFTRKGGSFKRYKNKQEINSCIINNVEKELSFLKKRDLDKKNSIEFRKVSKFSTEIRKKNDSKNKK